MSSECPSFEARLFRHAAEVFAMPAQCRNRSCRRTGTCRGSLSAEDEPRCVAGLGDNGRRFVTLHVTLAGIAAGQIHQGEMAPATGDPFDRYSERLGLLIAATSLADHPANRPLLRRRLRAMQITAWPGRPPRTIAHIYATHIHDWLGQPPADAGPLRDDGEAAAEIRP